MEAPANKSRKQIKERKNRTKKLRGAKKKRDSGCREEVGCSSCGALSEGSSWKQGLWASLAGAICYAKVVHAADACRNGWPPDAAF